METPANLLRKAWRSAWGAVKFDIPSRQELRHAGIWFYRRAMRIRIFDGASSLSYASLLSLTATLICAFNVYHGLINKTKFTSEIRGLIYPTGGADQGADWLEQMFDQVQQYSSGKLTPLVLVVLVVTGSALVSTLEGILNNIWFVRRSRSMVMRLVVYWGAVSISPILLMLSVTVTAGLQQRAILGDMIQHVPGGVEALTSFALTMTALTWIYKVLPNTFVPLWPAVVGGFSAGILWETAKRLFGFYAVRFASENALYSFLGGLPLFLVWVYVGWLVVLTGALITYGVQNRRSLPWASGEASRECLWSDELAYRIMYVIANDFHNKNDAPLVSEVVARVQASDEQVRILIERLLKAGFLEWSVQDKESNRGLRPTQSLDQMCLSEVLSGIEDPHASSPWGEATRFSEAVAALRERRPQLGEGRSVRSLLDSEGAENDARG